MGDIRESTETFIREKIEPRIERHVDKCMRDHMDQTQAMNARTMDSMEKLQQFQHVMTETIIGKIPPDPDKPGMWESLQNLLGWKRNVNKVLWIGATAVVGVVVRTVWVIMTTSGVQ